MATWGLRDRGVKRANFTVLTATAMPAALTEMGFINHCERDSALLGNAGERQRIAEAQARAVAEYLGADVPPPGPAVGVLRGVVFEDVGVGLEDTSIRLAGARVRVEETGDVVQSAAETAGWSFELEPGEYTVRVTLDGFDAGERRCPVTAGADAWCSVGLRAAGNPPPGPDAATQPPDAGDADAALGHDFERLLPPLDTGLDPDAVSADGAVLGDGGLGFEATVTQSTSGDSGCTVSPGGAAPWWLALLLLPFAFRRPRVIAALALLCGTAGAHVPDVDPNGVATVRGEVHPELRPTGERVLIRGAFAAPRLAPDGRHVALPARDLGSLYVARVANGALQRLATGRRVGLAPRWHDDGRALAFRAPGQSPTAVPLLARTLDGSDVLPEAPAHGVRAWVADDVVYAWRDGTLSTLSPPGDRYFHVRVAPDGAHVVFWGLRTGLHLVRLSGDRRFELGSGGHPSFDPTGQWLVFERTEDEGAQLVSGDLFLLDLRHPDDAPVALTQTPDRIELAPSIAAGKLVFIAGDSIVVADLPLPTNTR